MAGVQNVNVPGSVNMASGVQGPMSANLPSTPGGHNQNQMNNDMMQQQQQQQQQSFEVSERFQYLKIFILIRRVGGLFT